MARSAAIIGLVLTFAMARADAQGSSRIAGTITDFTGSVIPGAQVALENQNNGIRWRTESSRYGYYAFPLLEPGRYRIIIHAGGFAPKARSGLRLHVAQSATVNVTMEVGEITTTIEVEGSEPLLNTTIATLGQVVENKYLVELPLIGRNPMRLTYLAAGVVSSGGRLDQANTNFVANGSRNATSDVILDGVSTTNVEQNAGITQLKYTPSVDAIQEFKVQTNFFSAEYGNTGGAIVNMVTKSGTNEIHGTAYWFLRNDRFNANSFFANRSGSDRPEFKWNQVGGVLGGPVRKNRTFFFGTLQYTDERSPLVALDTFPTMQQRAGDFSDDLTSGGDLIQVFNPFDTYTGEHGAILRRPFPNSVVPRGLHDPVALAALSHFPQPNQAGSQYTNRDNYFVQGVNASSETKYDIKVDHVLNDMDRLMGRYSRQKNVGNPDNLFGAGNPAHTYNRGPSDNSVHQAVFEWNRTVSPTTMANVRFGVLRVDFTRDPFQEFKPSDLGLPSLLDDNASFLTFPEFAPEGYQNIGTQGWLIIGRGEDVNQLSGSVTKIAGAHSLRVGGEFRHIRLDYLQPGYPSGRFVFNRQVTREDRFAGSGVQGNGLASMLLGWGSGSSYHIDPWSFSRSQYYAWYVQDDWKITRRLTMNLGLRYDFDRPRWERDNRYSYWNLNDPHPINDQVPEFDLRGFYEFVDDDRRSPFPCDCNNWAPRLGLAYALDDNTSIRAGWGVFYQLSRATVKGHLGSPFQTGSGVEWSRDANASQYATLADPYPNGLTLPTGRSLGALTFLGLGAGTAVPENTNPYYQNWNVSIQRQVPGNGVLEVNYTGSKGVHLLFAGDTNLKRLDPQHWGMGRTALNEQVPNPFYGIITDPRSVMSQGEVQRHLLLRRNPQFTGMSRGNGTEPARGNSSYHALQVRFQKRYSSGLDLITHYTWSKMIDDISHGAVDLNWLGGGTSVQDWSNLRNERSLSAHDVPQRLVVTFNYELPVGNGKAVGTNWGPVSNALVGGWTVSSFASFQSGVPLSVTQSGGTIWDASQRPHLRGNPDPGGSVYDRLTSYFNESAFERPLPDTLGNAPRTLGYRGPAATNVDLMLSKFFRFSESQSVQFRFEMQNATNTPTFGTPNTSFESGGFGRITGYQSGRGPRVIQLGVKYIF